MCFSSYTCLTANNYVDFAVENPRKLKEKPHTNWLRSEEVTTAIEKIQDRTHPLSCFFAAERPQFNLGAY
jgi:hypothetical protein